MTSPRFLRCLLTVCLAFAPAVLFGASGDRLIQGVLTDRTDDHVELAEEKEFPSGPENMELSGNAFALEKTDGAGEVFLKLAPLPAFRGKKSSWDVRWKAGGVIELNRADGYEWVSQKYGGGKWGRIAAAHALQRGIRPYDPTQDGLFLANTWGDRSRDSRLNEDFLRKEILAAKRLGVDVVQIDDGWQTGVTKNSAAAAGGGTWNGFWASDPKFWNVNAKRFPRGLEPLAEDAKQHGIELGLWFAPDSSGQAANWQRDANVLIDFWKKLGIRFFKVDAMKITSAQSEKNLLRLFETARKASQNQINFDFDITAQERFGYFGAIEPGRLFLENRYTDSKNYWPHKTLRAVWKLAHWVEPVRLRVEWLNNARNAKKYGDDPLAPAKYRPDALFAITMFCSPLGWFEIQNLPPAYFQEAGPVIAKWRQHRQAIFEGNTFPIGDAPDGQAWTGFASVAKDQKTGYALVFRELNAADAWSVELPGVHGRSGRVEVLGGEGRATLVGGKLQVVVPKPLGYLWVRYALAN